MLSKFPRDNCSVGDIHNLFAEGGEVSGVSRGGGGSLFPVFFLLGVLVSLMRGRLFSGLFLVAERGVRVFELDESECDENVGKIHL